MKAQFLEQKGYEIIYSSIKYESSWPDNTDLGFPKYHVPLWKHLYRNLLVIEQRKSYV